MITALHILWVIYKIILALVGLNFLVFLVLYGFKKSWAVTRWLLIYTVIAPAQLLSLLFPFAWIFRFMGKWNPFWIVMDDSRIDKTKDSGYANDYWVVIQDAGKTKETFWIAFWWHIKRNRVYNLLNLFKVPDSTMYNSDGKKIGNNFINNVDFISNNLYKNDKNKTPIAQDGNWVTMAGLKYIPKRKGDDIFQVNQGDEISIKTSIIGKGGMFYGVGNWLSFRWSYCKIVNYLFFKRCLTIKI